MNVRILGNQPEPTLTRDDAYHITDFEVRTKDLETFEHGKILVDLWIKKNDPTLEGCQFNLTDPMTVGIYPMVGKTNMDSIVLMLEEIGFYGKSAGYSL